MSSTESPTEYDIAGVHGAEIFRTLPTGLHVKMNDGLVGEIIANPGDGAYLIVKVLESPREPGRVGEEQPVYFMDVASVFSAEVSK